MLYRIFYSKKAKSTALYSLNFSIIDFMWHPPLSLGKNLYKLSKIDSSISL